MALRLQVDGLRNAADHVVKDGEGTTSAPGLSNVPRAAAGPFGAPKPGTGRAEIRRQGGV
jgi:hypothetical protein